MKNIITLIAEIKWYWKVLWFFIFFWGACRLVCEQQLQDIRQEILNEHSIFRYEDSWSGDEEIKKVLQKDFLENLAHITIAYEKETRIAASKNNRMTDSLGKRLYKYTYLFQKQSTKFSQSVWQEEPNQKYLDVLDIYQVSLESGYSVSVSKKDLQKIRKNKKKILNGEIKLRSKNFDTTPYKDLKMYGFYTYLKDEKDINGPYRLLFVGRYEENQYAENRLSLCFKADVDETKIISQPSGPEEDIYCRSWAKIDIQDMVSPVHLKSPDTHTLVDKYARENTVYGRKGLSESFKIIEEDLAAKGNSSRYYSWVEELRNREY